MMDKKVIMFVIDTYVLIIEKTATNLEVGFILLLQIWLIALYFTTVSKLIYVGHINGI